MAIAIISALHKEIKPLLEATEGVQKSKWRKRSLYHGVIGEYEVVAASCGVGKVRAAACTQYLIDSFSVEAVICCGVAGAVDPQLGIGDIIVAKKALEHDFDLGDAKLLRKLRRRWVKADPRLVEAAMEAGKGLGFEDRMHLGTVLTGDQAIASEERRERLWDEYRGQCVDMEGAAVAQVCRLNSVPFLIVRAVSDTATEGAEKEFKEGLRDAAEDAARLVLRVIQRTMRW